jgi:hypothetical protein
MKNDLIPLTRSRANPESRPKFWPNPESRHSK